ncbi:MAG: hypothetical protein H7Z42_03025, partial [Roseiflexaceae bacterium]|nr:hypothetical protein [Roseiflexaceae bacterium]
MTQNELDNLLELERDGQLSAEQAARLEHVLATNQPARAYWQATKQFDQRLATKLQADLDSARLSVAQSEHMRARLRKRPIAVKPAYLLAAFLFVSGLLIAGPPVLSRIVRAMQQPANTTLGGAQPTPSPSVAPTPSFVPSPTLTSGEALPTKAETPTAT